MIVEGGALLLCFKMTGCAPATFLTNLRRHVPTLFLSTQIRASNDIDVGNVPCKKGGKWQVKQCSLFLKTTTPDLCIVLWLGEKWEYWAMQHIVIQGHCVLKSFIVFTSYCQGFFLLLLNALCLWKKCLPHYAFLLGGLDQILMWAPWLRSLRENVTFTFFILRGSHLIEPRAISYGFSTCKCSFLKQ